MVLFKWNNAYEKINYLTKNWNFLRLQDMQHKIKEHFRGLPDEFMTSPRAPNAKVILKYFYKVFTLVNGSF